MENAPANIPTHPAPTLRRHAAGLARATAVGLALLLLGAVAVLGLLFAAVALAV